jgi:hypothetical protein
MCFLEYSRIYPQRDGEKYCMMHMAICLMMQTMIVSVSYLLQANAIALQIVIFLDAFWRNTDSVSVVRNELSNLKATPMSPVGTLLTFSILVKWLVLVPFPLTKLFAAGDTTYFFKREGTRLVLSCSHGSKEEMES